MLKNKVMVCAGVSAAGVLGFAAVSQYFKNKKELKELREKVRELEAQNSDVEEDVIINVAEYDKLKQKLDAYNNYIKELSETNEKYHYFDAESLKTYEPKEVVLYPEEFKDHNIKLRSNMIHLATWCEGAKWLEEESEKINKYTDDVYNEIKRAEKISTL